MIHWFCKQIHFTALYLRSYKLSLGFFYYYCTDFNLCSAPKTHCHLYDWDSCRIHNGACGKKSGFWMLIFKETQLKNWWSTFFFLLHFIHLALCLTKLIYINTILIRLAQVDTVSCCRLHKSHDLRISVIAYFYVPTSDPGCW